MDIQNIDGIQYLSTLEKNSIDLILTDPPYITSSETGMGNLHKQIQEKADGMEEELVTCFILTKFVRPKSGII